MSTITVWLLISLGGSYMTSYAGAASSTTTIAKFADVAECERVRSILLPDRRSSWSRSLQCVQATIVKDHP